MESGCGRDDMVELTRDALDVVRYLEAVRDSKAGGMATFVGTTRDTFQGKVVKRLEYEAYEAMAIKEMRGIVCEARDKWPLVRVALAHRLGVVPVTEASVIVAVSSVNRAPALLACHFLIDRLKASVPIWKKEIYADADDSAEEACTWKGNDEFFASQSHLLLRSKSGQSSSSPLTTATHDNDERERPASLSLPK